MQFKKGDEIWYFSVRLRSLTQWPTCIKPGDIELVHDIVHGVDEEGVIRLEYGCSVYPSNVWGKTRQEAFDRLKEELNKWGELK